MLLPFCPAIHASRMPQMRSRRLQPTRSLHVAIAFRVSRGEREQKHKYILIRTTGSHGDILSFQCVTINCTHRLQPSRSCQRIVAKLAKCPEPGGERKRMATKGEQIQAGDGDPEDDLQVLYSIDADSEEDARATAWAMALKNKVELPEDALTGQMHKSIRMPRITSVSSGGTDSHGRKRFYVHVVQPAEHAQDELPTILTATSRNFSFMAGIGVVDIHAPTLAVPRFSIDGVYDCIGASKDCPLIAFATKPVGNTSQQLASRAYAAVRGGFDIVKDDDKVANPCSAPFHERVQAIASAVRQASEGTGKTALYFANINAPVEYLKQRAYDAKATGVGRLLVQPHIQGFDVLRYLASLEDLNLPLMAHPAYGGSLYRGEGM